jgi:hypothetical protein
MWQRGRGGGPTWKRRVVAGPCGRGLWVASPCGTDVADWTCQVGLNYHADWTY